MTACNLEQAFSAMMIDDQRQAILISGESGAGKTESAKTVMQYLAQRAGQEQNRMHRATSANLNGNLKIAAPIEEQVHSLDNQPQSHGMRKNNRKGVEEFAKPLENCGGR